MKVHLPNHEEPYFSVTDENAAICAEINGNEVRVASSYIRLMKGGSDYSVTLKEDYLEIRPLI